MSSANKHFDNELELIKKDNPAITKADFCRIMNENSEDSIRNKTGILIQALYGYTDENNPFGDPNLSQTFIWELKWL